ncbi:hypothetical protein TIFTF001_005481 [Ficus carica]|uniref:Uncharacterized protein n=1 Tax=Ficus carica TaxID=3494 RepID=A0AA88A7X1_FICCA|nr:hypothetical protein TIFTF001_005481 [Ficus carica]
MSSNRGGYLWAVSAGLTAALAAISAKLFTSQKSQGKDLFWDRNEQFGIVQIVRYGLVVLFNVTMWGCYVNSLKALSSLQATVTNFATNFLTSGLELVLPGRTTWGGMGLELGFGVRS